MQTEEVTSVNIFCISNRSHGVTSQEAILFFGGFDLYLFPGREAEGFIVS